MEYDFKRNTLTGTVLADFNMEHQVLGRWFSEELADDRGAYLAIVKAISQVRASKLESWRYIGGDLCLELDAEQARVFASVLDSDQEHELDDSVSLYDAESECFCGLEDFESVLNSWREFLDETR